MIHWFLGYQEVKSISGKLVTYLDFSLTKHKSSPISIFSVRLDNTEHDGFAYWLSPGQPVEVICDDARRVVVLKECLP